MPPLLDPQRVGALVADVLGVEVSDVSRLQGSVANQDFAVAYGHGLQAVLKGGPDAEIAAEAWACGRLAELGAPVPRVLACELDSSRLGLPFLIATFVTGHPSADLDVAREAGAWFRRIHQEHLPGWGPVTLAHPHGGPPGTRGLYSSWREAVEADLAGLPELVEAGLVDEGLAEAVRALTMAPERLDYDGPGVLLHHDLKPAHLFGIGSQGRQRLSAIIDWGDASVGDPAADLARLSMSGHGMTRAFLDGYGVQLTPVLADRLTRYRLLWNVKALTYEYRAGGDWFDAYQNDLRVDTARLLT